jgi:catechol 2,3-dioxygenase-like lactoylglutathione lyase family enzyme
MTELDGSNPTVRQMRLVVTTPDFEEAVRFYRDVLGLKQQLAYSSEDGQVVILEAGVATLELADANHAAYVDSIEVGKRVAGHVRVAFEVEDAEAVSAALVAEGALLLAPAVPTPWNSLNSRLEAPAGLQLTIFEELG